jgi:hypothetical protein
MLDKNFLYYVQCLELSMKAAEIHVLMQKDSCECPLCSISQTDPHQTAGMEKSDRCRERR